LVLKKSLQNGNQGWWSNRNAFWFYLAWSYVNIGYDPGEVVCNLRQVSLAHYGYGKIEWDDHLRWV
jgi:hypothetical protein